MANTTETQSENPQLPVEPRIQDSVDLVPSVVKNVEVPDQETPVTVPPTTPTGESARTTVPTPASERQFGRAGTASPTAGPEPTTPPVPTPDPAPGATPVVTPPAK